MEYEAKNLKKFGDSICHRGEGNTPIDGEFSHLTHTEYSIDYLTFSFPFEFNQPLASIKLDCPGLKNYLILLDALNLRSDLVEDSFGTKGFSHGYKWPVPVTYCGAKNPCTRFDYFLKQNSMKIGCFELSGACCRDFERRYTERHNCSDVDAGWYYLFSSIIACDGAPSRLDVAFDIFNPDSEHQFDYYMRKIIGSEFSSPIGMLEVNTQFDDRLNFYKKQVLTLGASGSSVRICIYNKKLEQEAQGLTVFNDSWIRIEIRFYDEKAKSVIAELVNNWDDRYKYLVGVLKHYLQLKIRPNSNLNNWNSRKLRQKWKTDPYWESLFEDVDKKKIANIYEKTSTVQAKKSYLYQNYNRFLTILLLALSDKNFNEYQTAIFSKGFEALKPGDIEKINYFRTSNNLKELSMDDILDRYQDIEIDNANNMQNNPELGDEIEALNIETRDTLKKTIDKYLKNHSKNQFIHSFNQLIGDSFNQMSSDELRSIFESLLLFYK